MFVPLVNHMKGVEGLNERLLGSARGASMAVIGSYSDSNNPPAQLQALGLHYRKVSSRFYMADSASDSLSRVSNFVQTTDVNQKTHSLPELDSLLTVVEQLVCR